MSQTFFYLSTEAICGSTPIASCLSWDQDTADLALKDMSLDALREGSDDFSVEVQAKLALACIRDDGAEGCVATDVEPVLEKWQDDYRI